MEVVPIRWIRVRDLDPLFEEERLTWLAEMHWDIRSALELLRRHLELETVEGFALRGEDRALGYVYFVVRGESACLADAYVLRQAATRNRYESLLGRCLEELQSRRSLSRIEAQLVPFHCPLDEAFRERCFQIHRRRYLALPLPAAGPTISVSTPFGFRNWRPTDPERAAAIIYDSYRNSPEAILSRDYQLLDGCRRFVRNVTQSPSCGRFRADLTQLAFDERDDPVGLMMVAEISQGTLMIPQLSIVRSCQGKGLGKTLLSRLIAAAKGEYDRIALSVTESNRQAVRLYSTFGFEQRREFEAYVWSRENE